MWKRSSCALLLLLLAGCPEEEKTGPDKADFETAANDIRESIAKIAAYEPYLHKHEDKAKYAPPMRSDVPRSWKVAGNEVRSAANVARQQATRSTSLVSKELVPAFNGVSKACTNIEDDTGLEPCRNAIKALDDALAAQSEKATAAGAAALPRVAPEAVTDTAKKDLALFLRAMGPSEQETAYLAMRPDADVEPQKIVDACNIAKDLSGQVRMELEKVDEELRKLAATHEQALIAQCVRLEKAHNLLTGMAGCKDQKKEDNPECETICAASKSMITAGVPAATFEKMNEAYEESCEEEDKKK